MDKKRVGHWSALFGGPKPFEYEIKRAKDFDAKWSRHPSLLGNGHRGHTEVDFNGIPGWLQPLWGSDGEWLYIRRPEGVWRTRIPAGLPADSSVIFVQKKVGVSGDDGRMVMGFDMEPTGGWMDGFQQPCAPADIDARRDQGRDRQGVEVDFYAPPLINVVASADRLVVAVDDLFSQPPRFNVEMDWLVATDSRSGRRCAFPLSGQGHEPAKKALNEGYLWLRFEGEFLDPFEVKVTCASSS